MNHVAANFPLAIGRRNRQVENLPPHFRANKTTRPALCKVPGLRKPMSHTEEASWVRRAQRGDRAAFASLVDAYWSRLYRWLFGLTHDSHIAEDLTQDAFLKAWSKIATFQAGTHFRAWLFRIAHNAMLDRQRGARGIRPQQLPESLATNEPEPVTTLVTQELQTQLRAALETLPARLKAPFLLRTQDELAFSEIAQILAVTEETARWRVFKARRLLLNQLGDALDQEKP
jgi:RNA polymerase sigma-70 factor, ECF subfamily